MAQVLTRKTLSITGFSLNLLLAMSAGAATTAAPAEVVGEVTSVIGIGKVLNPQGEQTAVRGQLIHAGDQIETAAGGHVHVRFVDGGLVSVRPLSRLLIEDYHNRDAQNLAAIKFRLDVGVMRSVTGQWGEANRDRFRLNTPVAAIGIKGTDFVVKTQDASTMVSVKTGAVVMAPLEGSCAAALGPCAGDRSVQLSADMPGRMLEYLKQNDKSTPRLIPYVDLLARNAGGNPVAELRQADVISTGEAVNKALDSQVKEAVDGAGPVTVPPPTRPVAWLHNALNWNVPANTISTRFDEASAAGRRPVVGNLFISLYRDEATRKDFAPSASTANFGLLNASANYAPYGLPSEPATVSDGKLAVDFVKNVLTTQMNLASPSMGLERFVATATVTSQGVFVGKGVNQQLAGAFNVDARQAGYMFEKTLGGGTVSGLTLWGR